MDDVDNLLATAWKNAGAQQSQTELDLATALRDLAADYTALTKNLRDHVVARVRDLEHQAHEHQQRGMEAYAQQRLMLTSTNLRAAAGFQETARELRRVLDVLDQQR